MRNLLALAALLAAILPRRRRPAEAIDGPLPPATHERSDVGLRPMLIAGVLMLAGLGAMMGLAVWLYPASLADQRLPPIPRFPEPQLQTDTAGDMARFRAQQLRQLDGVWWIDQQAGTVHLPIARAMDDVARSGIPDWPR